MSVTEGDLNAVRADQAAVWDAVSAGWVRWRSEFEAAAATVSRRLVELAGLRPGHAVLDFGTGLGEPALTAAAAVGPDGHVLGVDLSLAMVTAARTLAADATAAAPVRFAVGGAEAADPPATGYDAVLSRWALPFTGDRVATMAALGATLRPGGVLAAAVWGPPQVVPMIALGFAAVSGHLGLGPPPGGPGPFAMAEPGQLAREVAAAGLADVTVEEVVVPFRLRSTADFARFTADVLPPRMRATVRARCTPDQELALWRAVAAAADRYAGLDGTVALPSTALCVRATA